MGGGSEVLVVYGFDSYNQTISAETSQTIKEHGGGDTYPKVLIMEKVNNAEGNRNIEPRSASGKL